MDLAHPAVECVVPTLIQEAGPDARRIEDKRRELAGASSRPPVRPDQVAAIAAIGDNRGSMRLGREPEHEGPDAPDRWSLSDELIAAGERYGVEPERDLRATCPRRGPSPERADVRLLVALAPALVLARGVVPCLADRRASAPSARSSRSGPVSLEGADPRVSDHVVAAGEADAIARVRQHVVPA